MSDTSQLVKLVDGAADVGLVVDKFVVTPGPVLAKVGTLLPLVADVELFAGVDYAAAKAQVAALDAAGEAALIAELGSKLTSTPVVADVIEGLDLLWQLEQLSVKFVAYGKKLKG